MECKRCPKIIGIEEHHRYRGFCEECYREFEKENMERNKHLL